MAEHNSNHEWVGPGGELTTAEEDWIQEVVSLDPGANEILGRDSTDTSYEWKSLVAGDNISITNSAGQILISSLDAEATKISIGDDVVGGIAGSVLFVNNNNKLDQDLGNFFWDDTNNRLGIGTNSPSVTLEVDGEIRATGDINASTDGSSTATPRVFGYKDLTSGEACRFQFGDEHNAFQNGFAQDTTIYAYWGLVLRGGRQNFSSGFEPPPFTKTTDTGVLIISDNDIGDDPGEGATNIVTLGIKAVSSQTNNLTEWRDSNDVVLTSVDSGGQIGIGTSDPNEKLAVNGNAVLPKASANGIKVDLATPTFGFADIIGDQFSKNTGATKPTLATYNGVVNAWQFGVSDEAYISYHIPHDYVAGTSIFLHIHWSHIGTFVTGGTVTFKVTSIYAKAHNQAAFQSSPSVGTFNGTVSTTQYQQILTEVQYSDSTPTGLEIDTDDLEPDGVIELTFEVDANNLTVSSGGVPDIFVHFVDLHYQTTGVIGTKDKAPDFYA